MGSPNYDDRLKEPVVLPSRFPNLLVNGSVGIAVGMATNIPTHNLGEVIDGLNLLIQNPDCTLDDLMECIKGPDFPTGGIIMGKAGIRAAYGTGKGKIIVRAKTEITEIKNRQCIIVTEIPYMVNKARLVEHIAQLIKEKRIEGATFVRDESGRDGMRIVIGVRKDAVPDVVLNQAFPLYPASGYLRRDYARAGQRHPEGALPQAGAGSYLDSGGCHAARRTSLISTRRSSVRICCRASCSLRTISTRSSRSCVLLPASRRARSA